MRNLKIVIATLTIVVVVLLTAITSRKQPDVLGYRAAQELTAVGTVADVQEFFCPVTEDRGTHVVLKTANDTVLVHVAISRFLREHQIAIRNGERLQVTGARIRFHGKDGMIAREIVRGDEVFILRDAAGKPLWD